MKNLIFASLGLALCVTFASSRFKVETAAPLRAVTPLQTFGADNPFIQYTGRIDFSNPKLPRFSSPGVYVQAKFKGPICDVMVNDEELWGKTHNYLEVQVDDKAPVRLQTMGKTNTFRVAENLKGDFHTVTVCKNTEAGMGNLEFVGIRAQKLVRMPPKPARRIEFIGDSITCGAEADLSKAACGVGEWYDRHNAYLAYGPRTARALKAQWQLTSVSGIGLMHSCCDMKLVMPDVFDKLDLRTNSGKWDFKRYQADAVTICLGQNDGIQDATAFETNYIKFLAQVRAAYPRAQIVLLSSPMADARLRQFQKTTLTAVAAQMKARGDAQVSTFFFSRGFNSGCGGHPDIAEHGQIADELSNYLKTNLDW